jgi:hypothetical protein
MKLAFSLSLVAVAAAAGTKNMDFSAFQAGSSAGRGLLASSRALEDGFEEAFVAAYSIIFQGCHTTSSWSEDGYAQSILVSFQLCPTSYCSSSGCSSSAYGEYVVDMNTFVDAYMEYQLEARQYKCETMIENCGCGDENSSYCLYYCFKDYDDDAWALCGNFQEGNNNDQQGEGGYGECQRFEIQTDDDGRRLDQDEKEEYFIGPYCGAGGTGIFLTLFSDEECSMAVSNAVSIYKAAAGTAMPYSSESLVVSDCVSCLEMQSSDDDGQDADAVTRLCQETYAAAAKCETNMDSYYKITTGCSLVSSVKSMSESMSGSYHTTSVSTAAGFVAAIAAVVGTTALIIRRKRRKAASSKTTPLVEAELSPVD